MTDLLPSLERRLARIERRNHMLTAALLVLAGAFLVAARHSAPPAPGLIQAQRFQLVDAAGTVWVDIRHDSTETGLFVQDDAGDTRVGVAQFGHGGGGFALHGPGMRGAAVLYLKGEGSLTFYDSTGTLAARVPTSPPLH